MVVATVLVLLLGLAMIVLVLCLGSAARLCHWLLVIAIAMAGLSAKDDAQHPGKLFFSFIFDAAGVLIAAGVLYPFFGLACY